MPVFRRHGRPPPGKVAPPDASCEAQLCAVRGTHPFVRLYSTLVREFSLVLNVLLVFSDVPEVCN